MAVSVKLKTTGITETERHLREVKARMRDFSPAMAVPAERLKSLIDAGFASSKAPSGAAWATLATSTIEQKTSLGLSLKPLIRRGARGLQGAVFVQPTKTGLRFGVSPSAPHGVFHQDGTRTIPARPFLPVEGPEGQRRLMGGRVKKIVDDMLARVGRYIATGKL